SSNEAERVVWVQTHMQAAAPSHLRAIAAGRQSYVLRELQPREDRLNLKKMHHTFRSLEDAVQTMGRLLAWAQLRASGRRGAASADALVEYVRRPRWRQPLTAYAMVYARRVHADFEAFKIARDRGFFDDQCAPPTR